jgi:hypothetical protein
VNPAEAYILSKPEPWRIILMELQAVIKHSLPEIEEQFKWHLPFYSIHGRMCCFLNFRKTFVDIGFTSGVHIKVHEDYLIAGEGRKNLRSLRYSCVEDINVEALRDVLLAAAELNRK